jgi:hypothetical protein
MNFRITQVRSSLLSKSTSFMLSRAYPSAPNPISGKCRRTIHSSFIIHNSSFQSSDSKATSAAIRCFSFSTSKSSLERSSRVLLLFTVFHRVVRGSIRKWRRGVKTTFSWQKTLSFFRCGNAASFFFAKPTVTIIGNHTINRVANEARNNAQHP